MPRNGRPKAALRLTELERAALLRQSQTRRHGRTATLRARVILACSEGRNNREVARLYDLAEHTVGKWRSRFVAARLDGLRDRRSPAAHARPRRAVYVATVRELAQALSQRAPFGPWSLGQALVPAASLQPMARARPAFAD